MKALQIASLVTGIILLVMGLLVLGLFAIQYGLSSASGRNDYDIEQESRAAASQLNALLDRSLFTTATIHQGGDVYISLVPTEDAWQEQQKLIDELNEIETVEHLDTIYLQAPNHQMKLTYELSDSFGRSGETRQGFTDSGWRIIFSQLEKDDGKSLEMGGVVNQSKGCLAGGDLTDVQIDLCVSP